MIVQAELPKCVTSILQRSKAKYTKVNIPCPRHFALRNNIAESEKVMIYTQKYQSPLGEILMAEKENALIGLWIEGQKYFLSTIKEETVSTDNSVILKQTYEWLERYFAGDKPAISELSLAPHGSSFRQSVWKILCKIPYGEVTTYGAIAKQIADSRGLAHMSAQAVGGAVGHNPISIIIPCHRVVGSDGSMTGYAGGIDKKIWLLNHEKK